MADERIRLLHGVGRCRLGGVETFVLLVARHIDRARFAVSVVVSGHDGPLAGELRRAGARGVRRARDDAESREPLHADAGRTSGFGRAREKDFRINWIEKTVGEIVR